MRKVMFVSNTANFSKFNIPLIRWFQENGFAVHYTSNGEEAVPCDREFKLEIARSPFSLINIKALLKFVRLLKRNNYALIHCHTPMGGFIARMAAAVVGRRGPPVIYTAHGFHFYRGAPILNWALYFPIEKFLARFTDCLILINHEDYRNALSHRFLAGQLVHIDGVGVNLDRFRPVRTEEKARLRRSFGISNEEFVVIYVAEFIKRKNHALVVDLLEGLRKRVPSVRVLFAGTGRLVTKIQDRVKALGACEYVSFLGYRKDVQDLYALSDIAISASTQEGLPMNIIEGMASGLPIVCSQIRGHIDLVEMGVNGFLYDLKTPEDLVKYLGILSDSKSLAISLGEASLKISRKYATESVLNQYVEVYQKFI